MTTIKTPEQIAQDAMDAFTFVSAEPDDENNDVVEVDYYFIRDQITAAIEADRAQRVEGVPTATHDSRCTLDRAHIGACNVNEWRG